MTHKSRIWRDIDKHPLPDCSMIDVKLGCGSVLITCTTVEGGVFWSTENGSVIYRICDKDITQWRDAK